MFPSGSRVAAWASSLVVALGSLAYFWWRSPPDEDVSWWRWVLMLIVATLLARVILHNRYMRKLDDDLERAWVEWRNRRRE